MIDLTALDESYCDGFRAGANWKDVYIPGGPWYFNAGKYDAERVKAIAAQTCAEHAAWMQGFYDGNGIELNAQRANITRKVS